jgi:hypothetical protein
VARAAVYKDAVMLVRRDVFLSHASDDKDAVARPLADQLRARGVSVWFDEYELELGDSLRKTIGDGLRHSRVGVVILSPSFFSREWSQWELDGLTARQIAGEPNVILPVWHDVELEDVRSYSPPLADLFAVRSSGGVEVIANQIVHVLNRIAAGGEPRHALADLEDPLSLEAASSVTNESPAITSRLGLHGHWRVAALTVLLVAVTALIVIILLPARPLLSYNAATRGAPMVDDSLRDSRSDNHWYEGAGKYGTCRVETNGYHVIPTDHHVCCRADISLDNIAVQVDMIIKRGNEGGLAFRWNNSAGFFFHLTSQGNYRLFALDPRTEFYRYLRQSSQPSPAIRTGPNQSNRLAVLVQGANIQLYVNDRPLATIQSSRFSNQGGIALCAREFGNSTEVVFNNIKVWRV